jgi:hypothetical protein
MGAVERVWAKFPSHEEARQTNLEQYRRMPLEQRLHILLDLIAFHRKDGDASSERLERVYRESQLKRTTGRAGDKAVLEALGAQ